jgi:Exostosin family
MAAIFLTTTFKVTNDNPQALRNFDLIVDLARNDIQRQHHIVDCPAKADIVLFISDKRYYHSGIYRTEIFKEHSKKSLIFDFHDRTIPRIPGLYATIPTYLHSAPIYEYGFYPYNYGCFDLDAAAKSFSDYKYLFSFMGSVNTCPNIRGEIVNLIHPRSHLQDTFGGGSIEIFSDVLMSSKFILCPRGIAPSTIRAFEAMRAGRVPVIIADEWRENIIDGEWKEFSVRIPEKDIKLIPEILESLESQALEMGGKARLAWEKNFSQSNGFHWLVETCLRIQKLRGNYEQISARKIYLETIGTHHFVPFWKEFILGKLGRI